MSAEGNPNSIYAIKTADGTLASFTTGGSGASGAGGTAIGTDGVVYAQIASGHGNVAGAYNDTVLSLKADDLTVQDYFTPPVALPEVPKGDAYPNVTPTVFGYEDKDWIVTRRARRPDLHPRRRFARRRRSPYAPLPE